MLRKITIFLIFHVLSRTSSQETPGKSNQSEVKQGIEWDGPEGETTLRIYSSDSRNSLISPTSTSAHPLMYSNQWKPFLLPINWDSLRNSYGQNTADGHVPNIPFRPMFLRRPDSGYNWTTPFNHYQEPAMMNRNLFPQIVPLNPTVFYPNHVLRNQDEKLQPQKSTASGTNSEAESTGTTKSSELPTGLEGEVNGRYFQDNAVPRFHLQPPGLLPIPPFFTPPYRPSTDVNLPNTLLNIFDDSKHVAPEQSKLDIIPKKQQSEAETTDAIRGSDSAIAQTKETVPNIVPAQPIVPYSFQFLPHALGTPILPSPVIPETIPDPVIAPAVLPPSAFPVLPTVPQNSDRYINPLPFTNPQSVAETEKMSDSSDSSETEPTRIIQSVPKIPYEFGYEMNDGRGNDQHRQEISDSSGLVTGSYGYRDNFGVYRLVTYVADKNGFRAVVKSNEPGVLNPGSADVVVDAEQPPTIVSGGMPEQSILPEQSALVPLVPGQPEDLMAEGSETKTE